MSALPARGERGYFNKLRDWLTVSHNEDGTIKTAILETITPNLVTQDDLALQLGDKADVAAVSLKADTTTVNAISLVANRVQERVVDVRDYGAVGGALGTTVVGAGENIATIRTETGQDWLEDTDTMDLVAYYRARVEAELTGRTIYFPRDHYLFTAPGFVTTDVDLGGSRVTNINTDASRFVRSNRCFILGILAREDFAKFVTQGWEQTCDDMAQYATTATTVSGTMPSVGDVMLIRTTTASGTLPDYVTMNEVADVAGTTITWRFPVELAMVDPILVNYSTITTVKSDIAAGAEPHEYFCTHGVSLFNGTVEATDGPAFEVNCALDFAVDIHIDAPQGQGVYGNCFNRGRVRVSGVCGGPKGAVELAVGSALSTVEVDLRYSGDDSDSAGSVSGNYAHIQLGEHTESCVVRGRLHMGAKPANHGVTMPTGNRNLVDVEMVGAGITANAVVFASNTGTGNVVKGRYTVDNAGTADYFCLWSAGTGTNNWLDGAVFYGTPGTNSLRFNAANLGGAKNVVAPNKASLVTGAGNAILSSLVNGTIVNTVST